MGAPFFNYPRANLDGAPFFRINVNAGAKVISLILFNRVHESAQNNPHQNPLEIDLKLLGRKMADRQGWSTQFFFAEFVQNLGCYSLNLFYFCSNQNYLKKNEVKSN